jgi:hypothetical protein
MTTKPPTIFRLRMRSVDADRDADDIRHLRALLKVLLRKYRFRVVEIEQEPAHPVMSSDRMG